MLDAAPRGAQTYFGAYQSLRDRIVDQVVDRLARSTK